VSFEGGGTGSLHTSLASPAGEYRVHVQGTKGNLVHGGFGGSLRWKDTDGQEDEARLEDLSFPDPYDRELESWLDSLTAGSPPLLRGEDGRANVAIAEAAYRSAQLGVPVRIDAL
jgi:predicted dehydrogenase